MKIGTPKNIILHWQNLRHFLINQKKIAIKMSQILTKVQNDFGWGDSK